MAEDFGRATIPMDAGGQQATPAPAPQPQRPTLADIEASIFSRNDISTDLKIKAFEHARVLYSAREADEARQLRETDNAAKRALHHREDQIWEDVYSNNPHITASSIATDPAFEGFTEERTRMINLINNPPGSAIPSAQSALAARDILNRIRLPYGDPQKITDLGPIYEAAIGDPTKGIKPIINKSDLEFVKKEFDQAQTANGEQYNKVFDDLVKRISPMMTKSNPLMGTPDPVGDAQIYNFERAVAAKKQQYLQEGKDPMDLLNPTKPDFVGRPEFLSPFQTSMQSSMQGKASAITQVPQWPNPNAPTPAVPQRRQGETVDEFLKRTQGGGATPPPPPPPPQPQAPLAR